MIDLKRWYHSATSTLSIGLLLASTGCQSIHQNSAGRACLDDESSTSIDMVAGPSESIDSRRAQRMERRSLRHQYGDSCPEGVCDRPDDFSSSAIPAPLGTQVQDWNEAMICAGRNSQYVISRHEWFSGGEQLGPEGRIHLRNLSNAMLGNTDPIVVEAEPTELLSGETLDEALARTDDLNQTRVRDIIQTLQEAGVADAPQRVLLSDLDRVGLHGVEAPRVFNRMMGGRGQGGQGGRGGIGNGNGNLGGGGGGGGGGFF